MIVYKSGPFGFRLLFRLHGSAVLRALVPSSASTLFLALAWELFPREGFGDEENRFIGHPYAIGSLVAAFSFIITFRTNFAYNRYWEAAGSVHQMHSKWMDVAMALAAFHYQAKSYDKIRPPAFGHHPELQNVMKERCRKHQCTAKEMKVELKELVEEKMRGSSDMTSTESSVANYVVKLNDVSRVAPAGAVIYTLNSSQRPGIDCFASVSAHTLEPENEGPSLFLQEASHLMSLLSAVALATLRDDIEGAEIPIVEYIPGSKFPPVDPSCLSPDIRATFFERNRCSAIARFFFGISRGEKHQTLYNAARPFRVLGGVSDAEALILKNAKGPIAKVSLCFMWLNEFIQREHMAGSTGAVAPPIISRLYQYCSDGMLGYNQARKVAYVPFPFPHSQMTVLFIIVIVFVMPLLMFSFVNEALLGGILNFLTVLCFAGLNEVARELENPFRNAPNDLPLTNFQAQFNEGLVEMFAGFHPDAFWEVSKNKSEQNGTQRSDMERSDLTVRSSDYGSVHLSSCHVQKSKER